MKIQTRSLAAVKASLKTELNAAAEAVRLQYLTPGDGQAMAYRQKADEAAAYLANPSISPTEVPHILLEAAARGMTPAAFAALVISMRDQWRAISAKIEEARAIADEGISSAATYADAKAAAEVDWAAVLST